MSYGRLLEVGTPDDLYQRPQTEFVASFLGTANQLVGNLTPEGVEVGKWYFPISQDIRQISQDRRVQALFRPEDVALAPEAALLDCPRLGRAVVEEVAFGGAYERLRLRLPAISGVRSISPPVTYGSDSILVDTTRSPEQASRFPLQPGDEAWVGVHRIHILAHPGLSFLILTDGSLRAQAALDLGGQIARFAHARVTLLGYGKQDEALQSHLQEARKQLGSGLASLEVITSEKEPAQAVRQAVEQQPQDLIVMGFNHQEDLLLAEKILQAGEHHLLLIPRPQPTPSKALICVSGGEPGKDDVLFAGRLVRHLSADATLLTIVPPSRVEKDGRERSERFLESGTRSLSLLGVPARTVIRSGSVPEQILAEARDGNFDMVVLGAPLVGSSDGISLAGVVGQTLSKVSELATLIVRSHYMVQGTRNR